MAKNYAMVIVNPVAGRGATGRKWAELREQLTLSGLSYDYELTRYKGHAIEIARAACIDGYSFIIAVGGDGTVNEATNGILTSPNRENVTLGVINTGTGSDFVRTVGTPRDSFEACRFLARQERFLIDVGQVEFYSNGERVSRYFVNYCGTGFDSEVAETTNRMPRPSFISNTIPYVISLVCTLFRYRNREVRLNVDGNIRKGRFLTIVAANGRYFGGGMKIAPNADLSDGKLDVITVDDVGKLELLKAFPRIYKGTHTTHPKVTVSLATNVQVHSEKRMPVSADGELLGEGPITIRLVPQALAIAR
ncbi:MAG: diacylglycerol kinase family protein [Dehalococcoidales bacterium]|nr:diacylglycerol kinase family lipid kinase [Dehalococcoidales bacterium]MDD5122201.1 diacylglycerol kinase family lipid kinase [Dehalococcoidales bacterium]MDX9803383.1 diacylglycerol kinase family lipid kinase [Dehalococcoidales bacterium]